MSSTRLTRFLMLAAVAGTLPSTAFALTVPFTEHFSADAANWANGAGNAVVNYVAGGGPDGSSYASTAATAFNQADSSSVVLFRGQDEFNSSGHAFEGNWTAGGVQYFSAYVRHTAPIALEFFARFSTPSNFPGVAIDGTFVQPNTWTLLTYAITPSNPNLTVEGPPAFYNSTFANIGHIQLGYSVPTGFGADSNSYTYDLDQPSITNVPEPASCILVGSLALVGFLRRWRVG